MTACGLALPPDDFITWPTNQPSELRLGLRLRDLVGIGGDDVVDHLLDRAEVGDLLHAARLDERARVAALAPDDLEQILGDLAGDRALADQIDDRAELRGRDRRGRDVAAFLVEAAEQLVDHPVGRELAVARLVGEPASTVSKKSALSRSATSTPAS